MWIWLYWQWSADDDENCPCSVLSQMASLRPVALFHISFWRCIQCPTKALLEVFGVNFGLIGGS